MNSGVKALYFVKRGQFVKESVGRDLLNRVGQWVTRNQPGPRANSAFLFDFLSLPESRVSWPSRMDPGVRPMAEEKPKEASPGKRGKKPVRLIAIWAGVTLLLTGFLLVVLEGCSSLFLYGLSLATREHIAEELSTEFDSELGWVAKPNLDLPDFYGPGRGLRTESHGFRNNAEVSEDLPEGRNRFVCSGDSFTLGYGVDNNSTWCHLLGALAGVETVNMGQGAYGVDQSYLWHMRDGVQLGHQVHLLAFIDDDFRRAQKPEYLGFSKPMLEIVNNEVTPTNVPVPRDSGIRRLKRWFAAPSMELRVAALARVILRMDGEQDERAIREQDAATLALLGRAFEELARVNAENDRVFVLINLPTRGTFERVNESFWQRGVGEVSDYLGIHYIDLVPKLQALPEEMVEGLFIQPGVVPYRGAEWHYTREGNRWVAGALLTELRGIPEVAELLSTTEGLGG